MGFDFFGGRPTHHVETHHLVSALRWLASDPKGDHQAGNDRTVSLDRNSVLVVTQQVTAAQQMLELPKCPCKNNLIKLMLPVWRQFIIPFAMK